LFEQRYNNADIWFNTLNIEREVKDLKETLKEVFGYGHFRGKQEDIINNILSGRNTFVIMPTGAGKSLCYQLPAIIQDGTAIVISPLIALMKNQVDQLNAVGVNAQFYNSTLTKSEMNKVRKEVLTGSCKLLYVAPESLTKDETVEFLRKAKVSFVAIDEAHCISEWGHDFRPEYRRIKSIIGQLGTMPIIALTATATPKVQLDIQRNLQMEEADIFKSSFNRTNLYYEVRPKKETKKQLIRYIKGHQGKAGIVYCLSRKKTEELAELLRVNGVKAVPYHAGLDSDVRIKNQDDFLNEELDVIVATIAFGMGIDKPDVRFVIHYDTPKSLEGYYQETGRGGRDGLEGNCVMFFSHKDITKLDKFNKDKPVTERENARVLLNEMESYATSTVCRRRQLLYYFGEHMANDCGFCDNCFKHREKYEGEDLLKLAIEVVLKTGERFGIPHLAKVLAGLEDDYVKSYGHNKLDVFGKGGDYDENFWKSFIRQSMIFGYLDKDIDNIEIVKACDRGREFIESPHAITYFKDQDFTNVGDEDEEESSREPVQPKAHDEKLFEMLKSLRKKIAKEKNLPPYVIFQDPSLEEMATIYPTTKDDLAQVNGVGMGKVQKFGKPFIEMIQAYVDENDIITASDVVIKSSSNRSKNKIFIIQQIDRKIDLDEIAEAKGMSMDELIQEIEQICFSGTKLNLDYYIDRLMDEDRQDEVYDYFMSAETDRISVALAQLGEEEYSEEELRLMRIKFLSELAN
jgi:ATP-dependent DNA helicase RecQ